MRLLLGSKATLSIWAAIESVTTGSNVAAEKTSALDSDAAVRSVPSCENSRDDTGPGLASTRTAGPEVRTSKRRIPRSPPAQSTVWSPTQRTMRMPAVSPSPLLSVSAPVVVSKTLSSFLRPPVATRPPSLVTSTPLTTCSCGRVRTSSPESNDHSLTEKSAEAVATSGARAAFRMHHTAPLWPSNVPIQSPVTPSRTMGLPSTDAERINGPQLMSAPLQSAASALLRPFSALYPSSVT
eukprot:Amastigsp_a677050_48.p2 type:complete len:239 gc:universal Amastigsp_a677050_48:257-973(+)